MCNYLTRWACDGHTELVKAVIRARVVPLNLNRPVLELTHTLRNACLSGHLELVVYCQCAPVSIVI
jgi:hypothetical protein